MGDDRTAEQLAQERSDTAVVAALVPFCVIKAQQDPDLATLAKFQTEQSSYSRSDLVLKAGWATIGGKTSPDNALARACSDKLHTLKTGWSQRRRRCVPVAGLVPAITFSTGNVVRQMAH